jgi:rare lipoprotein A
VALSHSSIARPADQNQNNADAAAIGAAVVGIASTYNPFRPGYRSGGRETASGELYDQAAWTAAIQTNLRERFGGVHYGKNYRPTYALVSSQDKQVIVKINDVGPLEPGRVIDLNEQTMRDQVPRAPSLLSKIIPSLRLAGIHVIASTAVEQVRSYWPPGFLRLALTSSDSSKSIA